MVWLILLEALVLLVAIGCLLILTGDRRRETVMPVPTKRPAPPTGPSSLGLEVSPDYTVPSMSTAYDRFEVRYAEPDLTFDRGDCTITGPHSHRWHKVVDGVRWGVDCETNVSGVVRMSEGSVEQLLREAGFELVDQEVTQ